MATLIGNAEAVYDPQTCNDRSLLGLKGAMSEAVVHILEGHTLGQAREGAPRGVALALVATMSPCHPEMVKGPDKQLRGVGLFDYTPKRAFTHLQTL